jgi:hypothetical protein
MSEIIDILSIDPESLPRFTVDKAEQFVPVTTPEGADNRLKNARRYSIFQNGDSFSILTAGIVFPEAFTLWKDPEEIAQPCINFIFSLKGLLSEEAYSMDTLGQDNRIMLPMESYETAFDIFINAKKQYQLAHYKVTLNEKFFLEMETSKEILISMAGAPAALDGKTLALVPFVKILHNFVLEPIEES